MGEILMISFIIGFIAGGAIMMLAMCLAISKGDSENEEERNIHKDSRSD